MRRIDVDEEQAEREHDATTSLMAVAGDRRLNDRTLSRLARDTEDRQTSTRAYLDDEEIDE